MKDARIGFAVVLAVTTAVLLGAAIDLRAAPPGTSKKVQITCKPGWRGGAGGTYGGVGFNISCDNGRATQILQGTTGTAYSFRMGVEDQFGAYDCFFSGDSQNVNETCVEVPFDDPLRGLLARLTHRHAGRVGRRGQVGDFEDATAKHPQGGPGPSRASPRARASGRCRG